VVAINERPQSKAKRLRAPATLIAQVGNLAKDLAPVSAPSAPTVQPEPPHSLQLLSVLESAEACIRKQLATTLGWATPQQAERRTTLVVEQAKGSWHARNGKRIPPAKQVEYHLAQGTCTETEAVRYLASGACNKQDLLQFVGARPTT